MANRLRVGPPGWSFALGCATVVASQSLADGGVSLPDPNPNSGSVLADSLALHPHWVAAGDRWRRVTSSGAPLSTGAVLLWSRSVNGVPSGAPIVYSPLGLKRSDRYGEALAVAGDRLFVGSPGWDQSTSLESIGRVFVINLGTEVPISGGILPVGESSARQEFGGAIAAHVQEGVASVAVGAPGYGVTSAGARGRVQIVTDNGAGWTIVGSVAGPAADSGSRFAAALALNETQLAVGAQGGGAPPSLNWGRVYVYARANLAAAPVELTAPTPVFDDRFGASLAMSENLLVVGAPSNECDAGNAHVFRLVRGVWTHEATLTPPDAELLSWYGFGNSVALDRERVMVGSGATVNDELFGQRAAIFRRAGRSWILESVVDGASDGPADAAAAGLAALDPAGAVITQPRGGPTEGGALRFDLLPRPADLDFDGLVGASDLAIFLGAWGTIGVVPEDLSGDGTVDATDLALLIGEWSVRS